MRIVETLEREVGRAGAFLLSLSEEDWSKPTRCPPMTVLEVAAHVWRGGIRIREMLAAGARDVEPEKDRVTYFQYDVVTVSPEVVKRALETSSERDPATFPEEWRTGWDRSLAEASAILAHSDPVYPGVFGLIRLSEYLRTRIVEVTVHHMDLRDALGRDPDPDPAALEATADVLRALLGTDARPLGIEDVRFVLLGTGRAQLDTRERATFGPLAAKFPLLA